MALRTFPELVGLIFPVKKSPLWSTDLHEAFSGQVTGYRRWSYPKFRFVLGYDMLRSDVINTEFETLEAFFNLVGGRADAWKFHDPDDGAVTDQLLGIGNGAETQFQLIRSRGGFTMPVFLPDGTPTIKVEDVETPDFIVGDSGLITFDSAPADDAELTWSGTYDWLCRFDEDSADFEKFAAGFWRAGSIKFTTEKI